MHSRKQLEHAAKLAEDFDPGGLPMGDTSDLRELAEAVDRVRAVEASVRELVAVARSNERSWGEIGVALGVSRQAARERFADKPRKRPKRRTVVKTTNVEEFRALKERTVSKGRAKVRNSLDQGDAAPTTGRRSRTSKTRAIAAAEEAIKSRA